MATTISNTDRYAGTPEHLLEMMRSEDYWPAKYRALGALEFTLQEFTKDGDDLAVTSRRVTPADLPNFAKKVVGDKTIVVQSERWREDGAGYTCDFTVTLEKVPGGMTGWMRIVPVGASESDWILEFTIKVGIPLIGGKLEGTLKRETEASLKKEFAFNSSWLASH